MATQLNLRCCQDEPVSMMKHLKMLMPEASQHQSLTRSMPNHQFHPTIRHGSKQLVKLIATITTSWKSSKNKHLIALVVLPHFKLTAVLSPSLQSLLQHLLEMPHPWTLTQTPNMLKLRHATTVISRDTLLLIALNLTENVFVPT